MQAKLDEEAGQLVQLQQNIEQEWAGRALAGEARHQARDVQRRIADDARARLLKRPDPLGLKCDTITSPRRLVNTFIHQMITDLLKRDKPIKVAINFKSWSTTRDISSEWG